MAEKEGAKKWLALLLVLVIVSLVVSLLSLNVLYSISKSSNLGGELAQEAYSSSQSSSWKADSCVDFCTSDCDSYWSQWSTKCYADCKARYDNKIITWKQWGACNRGCSSTQWSSSKCADYCRSYEGGDPSTGVCCYQDWITYPDGSFECVYYF